MDGPRRFLSLDPFLEGGPVLGRAVANEGFFQALLAADFFQQYHLFLPGQRAMEAFGDRAASLGLDSSRVRLFQRRELPARLADTDYFCCHLSDCINFPTVVARLRNQRSRHIFPVTSVTHSLSYARYAHAFLAHLWPGTTPRDAVVATSRTAVDAVRAYYAVLGAGYGLPDAWAPAVKRIPLGVDAEALAPPNPEQRAAQRRDLGLEGTTAILCFARLSHHSKMDLLPLLKAFRRLKAGGMDLSGLVLVLAGWLEEGDGYPDQVQALAANLGLDCRLHPRPSEEQKRALFGAADLFCSPSDNPQETFGLTLLEAQAMGLPVVASDYDGYRDLVAHGATGLLVPTATLGDTAALDPALALYADTDSHLMLAQATAVDVPALAQALGDLLMDPERRAALGEAGRERVLAGFTWRAVVERYVALWRELWERPCPAGERLREVPHPGQTAYGRVFGGYATDRGEDLLLVWSDAGRALMRGLERPVVYAGLPDLEEESLRALPVLARKPATARELAARLTEARGLDQATALRCVLWALKHDFLERAP